MDLYVKTTSNCPGVPLHHFAPLGPEWTGDELRVPTSLFPEYPGRRRQLTVVGWTDLYFGSAAPLHVQQVRRADQVAGWLVWGGNAGVRVLDPAAPVLAGVNDHLPAGYGLPWLWLDDPALLPPAVRRVVAP